MDLPDTGILDTLADPGESTLFETSLKSRNPLKKFKKSLMLTGDFIYFFFPKMKTFLPLTSRSPLIRVFTYHHAASPGCSPIQNAT